MTGDEKSLWRAQAVGLLNRYGMASGLVVTFVLFASIILPAIFREREPPSLPPSDQPAPPGLGWLEQADAPPSRGKDLPPIDPATVMTPTPKLLARGEALFKQNCTSCHGDAGRGDGPAAASLNPKPRNFTQPSDWKNGYHIADIYHTISSGIQGSGMVAFDFILPADRMALVHYVRSLGSFDHGADAPAKLAALENQFRTQAVHIPNRIPVGLAARKMVREQAPPPALALPARGDSSPAAALLRRVIADPERAARTVAGTAHRDDLDAVARAWVAGSPANGFAPALAALSRPDWRALTRALLGTNTGSEASSGEETKR